jgi:PAS domain S-box-containing protein
VADRIIQDRHLRELFEQAPVAIILFDPDGRPLGANPAWEALWQSPRSVLETWDIFADPQNAAFVSEIRRAFTGEPVTLPPFHYDPMRGGRPGRARWVQVRLFPLRDEHGKPLAIVAMMQDVTATRDAEERLARKVREARLLHEATTLAADSDAFEAVLQKCVDGVCAVTGWPVGQVFVPEGQCLVPAGVWAAGSAQKMPALHAVSARARVCRGQGLSGRIWATGQPIWVVDIASEPSFHQVRDFTGLGVKGAFGFPIRMRGETVAVLEFFSEQAVVPDPEILQLVASLGEQVGRVLERRRAHEALRQSELRFQTMLDQAAVGIAQADRDGCLLLVNRRLGELLGRDPEALAGHRLNEFLHPDDATARLVPVEVEGPVAREHCFVRPDGVPVWLHCTISPAGDIDGRSDCALVIAQDVTERRRLVLELARRADALRRKNAELEQLLYSVSHDLRSPLVTILGFVGTLRDDLDALAKAAPGAQEIADVRDATRRIERAAGRLVDRTEALLELSRLGVLEPRAQDVDVGALVGELAEDLADRIRESGAVLNVPPDLPRVRSDRLRLMQVFENLLTNALKYGVTRPGDSVDIGAEVADGEQRFFVRDHGPGIPEAARERVFRMFQRLDRGGDGVGLGLTIVARAMEVLGGRAWVEPTAGGGATFWIALPQRS